MNPSKLLVTGASGFIGGRVVELLALERADSVRALVHKWSRAARVARLGVDIVAGDIMCENDAAAAMEGATHVVHCAYTGAPEVIIEGTRNLLKSALKAGVERFIYVSTAEVYGASAQGEIDEASPAVHCGNSYGDAKLDAEKLCHDYHQRGLSITIMRPAIVYGPFGASWTTAMANRLQSRNWCEFEKYGDGICNAVYVDDFVSAVVLAASHPAASGEVFNINGGEVGTWNEYFRKFTLAMQLPPLPKKSASHAARRSAVMSRADTIIRSFVRRYEDRLMKIYMKGGAASRIMKRVKTILDSTPSPRELEDVYSRRAVYTDRKARKLLGYRPVFDLEKGLKLSVQWLAYSGHIEMPAQGFELTNHTDIRRQSSSLRLRPVAGSRS